VLAGLLVGRLVSQRVEDLVDHAGNLALRDHEVAAAERAGPVRRVGSQDVEDAFGHRAIPAHAVHALRLNHDSPRRKEELRRLTARGSCPYVTDMRFLMFHLMFHGGEL
jgi:hypothetical protein